MSSIHYPIPGSCQTMLTCSPNTCLSSMAATIQHLMAWRTWSLVRPVSPKRFRWGMASLNSRSRKQSSSSSWKSQRNSPLKTRRNTVIKTNLTSTKFENSGNWKDGMKIKCHYIIAIWMLVLIMYWVFWKFNPMLSELSIFYDLLLNTDNEWWSCSYTGKHK